MGQILYKSTQIERELNPWEQPKEKENKLMTSLQRTKCTISVNTQAIKDMKGSKRERSWLVDR